MFDIPMLGTLQPWQATFIVVGLPGLLMSLLVLTIREPVRRGRLQRELSAKSRSLNVPLSEVVAFVRKHRRIFIAHNLGFAIGGIYAYAVFVWTPTFFIRTYHWTAAEAGI